LRRRRSASTVPSEPTALAFTDDSAPAATRRRNAPAATLPRPGTAPEASGAAAPPSQSARRATGHREHHVTQDYSYVHKDLITVAFVGAVVIAFIIAMSFSV
jgi:hypothetical protein